MKFVSLIKRQTKILDYKQSFSSSDCEAKKRAQVEKWLRKVGSEMQSFFTSHLKGTVESLKILVVALCKK